MNLNKLMKQAQKMQAQMAKTQAELEEKTVEVSAGGGKVTVIANGAGEVLSIKIDKEIVDPNDVEFLEEAVLSGVKQAVEQGKALAQSEMSKMTGGLGVGFRIAGRGFRKVKESVVHVCVFRKHRLREYPRSTSSRPEVR